MVRQYVLATVPVCCIGNVYSVDVCKYGIVVQYLVGGWIASGATRDSYSNSPILYNTNRIYIPKRHFGPKIVKITPNRGVPAAKSTPNRVVAATICPRNRQFPGKRPVQPCAWSILARNAVFEPTTWPHRAPPPVFFKCASAESVVAGVSRLF
jgi:hypothetical protein